MRNDLEVDLKCKVCGNKATTVIPMDRDRGFKFYCDEHSGGNDITTLVELANRGRSSVRR